MNLRGLCVCSFGLRTIAVLMSLFPSLGISSFRTAVCCDGENEYTTHARACQQDFGFFLDFFAFFCVPGWRRTGFTWTMPKYRHCPAHTGPSRASGTGMPGFTQYLYKFWHAAFTRPFDGAARSFAAGSRDRMPAFTDSRVEPENDTIA